MKNDDRNLRIKRQFEKEMESEGSILSPPVVRSLLETITVMQNEDLSPFDIGTILFDAGINVLENNKEHEDIYDLYKEYMKFSYFAKLRAEETIERCAKAIRLINNYGTETPEEDEFLH